MNVRDTLPLLWNVPYQRNPFFTGREETLIQLHQALQADIIVALSHPQGISGLGGVGKTQTAVEYAYRYHSDYNAVFWVQADSTAALTSGFVSLAHLLNLPERNEKKQSDIVEAVSRWLHSNKGWLLVFDNVDDLSAVEPLLPKAAQGHILLTTRAHALGGIAQPLEVQQMDPETGAWLLLRRASLLPLEVSLHAAKSSDRRVACEISQMLDGLPLALDQAGAYIKETACTLTQYLALYQARHRDLLRTRGNFNQGYSASVATTWSLSFEKVRQANPAAADLLYFCAFLAPDAIPEEIITKGASHLGPVLHSVATNPIQLDLACKDVLRFSLLQRGADTRMLTMHRLVQTVLRDSIDELSHKQWAERAVSAISEIFPNAELDTGLVGGFVRVYPERDKLYRRYLPHALMCTTWIEKENLVFPASVQLLKQVTLYYARQGDYRPAEPLANLAAITCAQLLGPDDPTTQQIAENYFAILFMIPFNTDLPIQFFPDFLKAAIKVEQDERKQQKGQVGTLFSTLLQEAVRFLGIERLEMAIKCCEIAIKIAPQELAPHLLLVKIYDKFDNADKMLKELEEAAKIDKKDPGIHRLMAEVYAWKKDLKNTIRELENAVKLGFHDIDSVVKEPNFEPFLSDPKMKVIIKKMKLLG